MEYNFREVELKWQKHWEESGIYQVKEDINKPKFYVLDMFPYPSGAGLHVGHPLGYIATDIYSRFKRLQGFNVLHPMGFDAFGLPAEQYAIETGQHPAVTTAHNITRYKEQLKNLGFNYDWSREVQTCDPDYYKWTQWMFLNLYNSWFNPKSNKAEPVETLYEILSKHGNSNLIDHYKHVKIISSDDWGRWGNKEKHEELGKYRLAYLAWSDVNWCPELGTVLANDEVKDGLSERGGHPVFRKKMRQWFLRITSYAQRLLDDLETIDWPEPLKDQQRNWIGRSEGASVYFEMFGFEEKLEIFTTRPDTIFGATFMVLAPEHEWVTKITSEDQKSEIEDYVRYVGSRSDVERQQEKSVTGAFTGSYCINPLTGKKIPVWISEYVLAGYGTGAIMAVPSDDDRDHAFATKFGLEIIEVIDKSDHPNATRDDKIGKMINSGFINGYEVKEAISMVCDKLEIESLGKAVVNYRLHDAGFSRQRYWGEPFPIVYENDIPEALPESDLPLILPETESYKPTGDGEAPLANNKQWVNIQGGRKRECDTMPGYAGSCWYYLRYMDPNNKNEFVQKSKESYWKNVDLYIGGSEHAVGHLMYSRFWHKVLFDLNLVSTPEPFKKLINQGMIQGRSSLVFRDKKSGKFVSQGLIQQYDVIPLHVDISMVENDVLDMAQFRSWREEFSNAEFILEDGIYKCGFEIEKMSKRWYNVVNPDDMVEKYGADCFRMYEMFLGPIDQHKPWDTKGIEGISRFIKKLRKLFYNREGELDLIKSDPLSEELKILHKCIKKVGEDTEKLSFNTAISAMMICVNDLGEIKCANHLILSNLLIVLSPFAPHLCEELWSQMGMDKSIIDADYPKYEAKHLVEAVFDYPVSFNGKMRFKIQLPIDMLPGEIEKEILSNSKSQKWLEGKSPRKVIVVPKRIVNVVI